MLCICRGNHSALFGGACHDAHAHCNCVTVRNAEIAEQFNVMSIPNMVFFKDGQAVDRQIGAVPQAALAKKFDGVLS